MNQQPEFNFWEYREDTRSGDTAHGITFMMWESQGRGEAAYSDKKYHLDGKTGITIAKNQWKYGNELIAQVYSKDGGKVFDRRANGYNRIQIYLGRADLQMAEMLESVAQKIRQINQKTKETSCPRK